jgi:hypothetical protein
MARCGVDLLGMDQLLPDDGRLEALVWSWAPQEPQAGECSVQRPDGRWEARACAESHPAACRDAGGAWSVTGAASSYDGAAAACAALGSSLAVPRTGRENELLRAAPRATGGDVWLGQTLAGGRWLPADPR